MADQPETKTTIARNRSTAMKLGEAAGSVEGIAIELGTSRVYRFAQRHPILYGLAAFIVCGGMLALFTMSTYKSWAFEGINLKVAVYQIIGGGFGAGIIGVILAFAYLRTIRPTLEPMRKSGIIGS